LATKRKHGVLAYWPDRLEYALSHKRTLCGIPVARFLPDVHDLQISYPKVQAALALIQQYDSHRFNRIQRDVRSILLTEEPLDLACWIDALSMCQLSLPFVVAPETQPVDIAAAIVHEATHARLDRLGIVYKEPLRPRIEGICFNAEITFAQRLPEGAAIVERARRQLERPREFWSSANLIERRFMALRHLGCPEWIISGLAWVVRRRAA